MVWGRAKLEYVFLLPFVGAILTCIGVTRLGRDFGLFSLVIGLVLGVVVFVVLWFAVGFYAWDYSMHHHRDPPALRQ